MNTSTATTSTAASAMLAAPIADESPAYRYAGEGRFVPANHAARLECARFNAWVDEVNARASKGLPQ